jgi:hypothetical protein
MRQADPRTDPKMDLLKVPRTPVCSKRFGPLSLSRSRLDLHRMRTLDTPWRRCRIFNTECHNTILPVYSTFPVTLLVENKHVHS